MDKTPYRLASVPQAPAGDNGTLAGINGAVERRDPTARFTVAPTTTA